MDQAIRKLARSTGYPPEAFYFVQRGLEYTVARIHGERGPNDEDHDRHVSGPQLCRGLLEYALQHYGLLARTVLRRWRILGSEDFGHIVFAMVEARLMKKTEDDRLEDFFDVFDFSDAFAAQLELAENV